VWLLTGPRSFSFSGPGSFSEWESVYAAGSSTLIDPSFPGAIVKMVSAFELLWLFGAAAVDTLSNVQVASGTSTTTFQVQNLVTGVGSPWPSSIQPLFRTLVFAEPVGIYSILGSTPQKLSDALDGLFPSITPIASDATSSVFTLNGILCYGVLLQIGGVTRLLVYTRPSWSEADQGTGLIAIATVIDATSGALMCWGTDGTGLFQCFTGSTGTYKASTKLFDFGEFTRRKTFVTCGVEAELVQVSGGQVADVNITCENGVDSQAMNIPLSSHTVSSGVTWVNVSGGSVTWQNSTGGTVTWGISGRVFLRAPVGLSGQELGMTLYGTSPSVILGAMAFEVDPLGPWTFST